MSKQLNVPNLLKISLCERADKRADKRLNRACRYIGNTLCYGIDGGNLM